MCGMASGNLHGINYEELGDGEGEIRNATPSNVAIMRALSEITTR